MQVRRPPVPHALSTNGLFVFPNILNIHGHIFRLNIYIHAMPNVWFNQMIRVLLFFIVFMGYIKYNLLQCHRKDGT